MKTVYNSKDKKYKITHDEYMQMRRDRRAKHEIKGLILQLFDKAKNWK